MDIKTLLMLLIILFISVTFLYYYNYNLSKVTGEEVMIDGKKIKISAEDAMLTKPEEFLNFDKYLEDIIESSVGDQYKSLLKTMNEYKIN